ncbi:uncharacterized protein UHOD_11799 [Ustilago sp. UG-2017b]|nr:uncharacterized protein UHOD_11799 [Ustilago sp. UG-2017b]
MILFEKAEALLRCNAQYGKLHSLAAALSGLTGSAFEALRREARSEARSPYHASAGSSDSFNSALAFQVPALFAVLSCFAMVDTQEISFRFPRSPQCHVRRVCDLEFAVHFNVVLYLSWSCRTSTGGPEGPFMCDCDAISASSANNDKLCNATRDSQSTLNPLSSAGFVNASMTAPESSCFSKCFLYAHTDTLGILHGVWSALLPALHESIS